MSTIHVHSEIGKLKDVILHRPGMEIEQMTPSNSHEALYSDILNLPLVTQEYAQFEGVLAKFCNAHQLTDLLAQSLESEENRINLIKSVLTKENSEFLMPEMMSLNAETLAKYLIEGYPYKKGVHPDSHSGKRYVLRPLYNLFFTRDASSSVYDSVLIHSMSTEVRSRESLIMEHIFQFHTDATIIKPALLSEGANTEGGDVLIAREDVLFIGNGVRTNKTGIEFLVNYFTARKTKQHILIQELPSKPDSFIHLDMVFNFLAKDTCICFEPLIAKANAYRATHIEIDNGKVSYHHKNSFLEGVKDLGFDLRPLPCGGNDTWVQEREQWHSGANFFCLDDGKVIGYSRNMKTIETLNQAGFEVLQADDICSGKVNMNDHKRFVVTFNASELPRGGGGARCMTMPFVRESVAW